MIVAYHCGVGVTDATRSVQWFIQSTGKSKFSIIFDPFYNRFANVFSDESLCNTQKKILKLRLIYSSSQLIAVNVSVKM